MAVVRSREWTRSLVAVVFLAAALALLPACTAGSATAGLGSVEPVGLTGDVHAGANQPADKSPTATAEAVPGPETASSSDVPMLLPATVLRIVDGDTALFEVAGIEERVRFIGVDTPETTTEVEPYGREAKAYTERVLPVGQRVYLETDVELRDRYGRLLAYVWLSVPTAINDTQVRSYMLNARLALDGYAQQMTIQPNSKYASSITEYVAEARDEERGLWSPGALAEPVAETRKESSKKSSTVFRTRTGAKYHADGCRHLAKSKIAISRANAESAGLSPCLACRP